MTPRETLLRYLRRETQRPIPYDVGFNPGAQKRYAPVLNGRTEREYFGCPTRDVRPDLLQAQQKSFDFLSLYPGGVPQGSHFDEWGIATSMTENGLVHVQNPLQNNTDIESLRDYPWPDYARPACYEEMTWQVEEIHAGGFAAVAKAERMIFAMGRDLRGYERHLADYSLHKQFNEKMLDCIMERQLALVRGMAASGADILWLSSDVASQTNVFIRPAVYRKTIGWRMAELFKAAKEVNPKILCAYHCCGNVVPIMEDILGFNIEILNPIQPESLDLRAFKAAYGERLVLWGGISVQHVLPHGAPGQVREEVKRAIEILGADGGYVVSPCNEVTEDIPLENLAALVEETRCWGE